MQQLAEERLARETDCPLFEQYFAQWLSRDIERRQLSSDAPVSAGQARSFLLDVGVKCFETLAEVSEAKRAQAS